MATLVTVLDVKPDDKRLSVSTDAGRYTAWRDSCKGIELILPGARLMIEHQERRSGDRTYSVITQAFIPTAQPASPELRKTALLAASIASMSRNNWGTDDILQEAEIFVAYLRDGPATKEGHDTNE